MMAPSIAMMVIVGVMVMRTFPGWKTCIRMRVDSEHSIPTPTEVIEIGLRSDVPVLVPAPAASVPDAPVPPVGGV